MEPVFFASVAGLALSFAVTALLRPVLPALWRWEWQGVTLHAGLWLMLYALLVLILGRPWFAMALGLAFLMLLVQVSNAKFHSLREAFVFQDFEYFTDAIKHPRLYIPFLGWWKFALIVGVALAALCIGLWLERAPAGRFALDGLLGQGAAMLICGGGLLALAKGGPALCFMPEDDLRELGFLACLWRYAWAEQLPMMLPNLPMDASELATEQHPDLLVVQSESFFDPRPLFSGIRPEILVEFDRLSAEALHHGKLVVPAWGANTVRSEFSFLCGAAEETLGVHRFNPYRKILNTQVVSLAKALKAAGYRTVCVHPYPASFYGRDKVFSHLGFDEFVDIRSFQGEEHFGPYVSDQAVTEKAKSLIAASEAPIFVFVITMENHGPLHLEKPLADEIASFYEVPPPPNCDDLTVYLRHLKNADQMAGELRAFLSAHPRPARFCWYGDHVPIMSNVYRQLGDPDGATAYFVWSNRVAVQTQPSTRSLHTLASILFSAAGEQDCHLQSNH